MFQFQQISCFLIFNQTTTGEEKVQNFKKYNNEGDSVTVDFNISTNEWNGKYFTSLQSWKVSKLENQTPTVPEGSQPFQLATNFNEEEHDDLPF